MKGMEELVPFCRRVLEGMSRWWPWLLPWRESAIDLALHGVEEETEIIVALRMAASTAAAPTMDTALATDESAQPELAILFIAVCLVLGIGCRQLLQGTKMPYTVALLLLGIALGASEYGTRSLLGTLGESIRLWSYISPSLILFVFLPSLLFESSFSMEVHQVKRCFMQMVLLAGPGVVISTFGTGLLIHYILPYQWPWDTSLLLGGLLSATDPVAVVALLKELGASKKLNTLIEGESLMNDGTAIVIFRLFLQIVLGQSFNAATVVTYLCRVAFGGIALGLGFGLVSVLWSATIFNDTVIEITLTLTTSYIAYYTAEDEAGVSGVLTVMSLGIFFALFGRAAFKGESQKSLHHFWEMVAYIANTLIFTLSGVVIAESILRSHNNIEGRDWGYLVLLYIFLQVSRIVVVVALYPGLHYFGYGLTWREAVVLVWAGLRGAVALSLALSVNGTDTSDSSGTAFLSEKTRARFTFLTGGVVFLTLIVNGSTTQFLLQLLGMQRTSDVKLRILEYTKYEIYMKALEAFGELGEDEELGPAEWQTVKKYITCLNMTEQPTHPHDICGPEIESQKHQLQDTRVRLLNGVQAAYWTMLEEGRVTQTSAMILMQSVDEALDYVMRDQILCDWKGLDSHVHFPTYLKHLWLQNIHFLPKRLLSYLAVERLEFGCYLSAAFLRAHRIARRQLREFIGQSDIAETVIKESEAEESSARTFLEDVRLTFPEVLRSVKTKQVTYSILNHLVDYLQGLEKVGLLEEKETNHLHDVVQADLKKLSRKPPLGKMPSPVETLSNQPFVDELPVEVQEPIKSSAKESMKLRGSILFQENSKAEGIFLIANGVVKWNDKASAGKHLLHPTFSHGSTLGLYEVLTGKPYLCDVYADSVVHCFYIEATSILSAQRRNPEIDEFFWKESALAITKILLPEHFEGISMPEMRSVVMDRSVMRTYLRGEVIDILPWEVGILLEGFLKQEGNDEIIGAPFVLTLLDGELFSNNNAGRTGSLPQQGASYHAESRSRIIVLDLTAFHSELRRSSVSLLSSRALPSRSSFEHEGLMRWPDGRYASELQLGVMTVPPPALESIPPSTRRSARAMQLGVFARKLRGRSNSWRVSSTGKMISLPGANNQPRQNPAYGKKHMSASVLPRPYSESKEQTITSTPKEQPQQRQQQQEQHELKHEDSSDGSDAEEEHIIRIDSPSNLFLAHPAHQR